MKKLSPKAHSHTAPISILLIVLAITTLMAGMVGCGGSGSAVKIRTWYDLDDIRDGMNGNYVLMNDLDSTTAGYEELASQTANNGTGWNPIGGHEWGNVFYGSFDGSGYKICDLFINRPLQNDVALFGVVGQGALLIGSIRNVGVVNFTVTGSSNVGGLVGGTFQANTVANCYATGNVTGSYQVGGLMGTNSGTVSHSYFTGSVAGNSSVGGLVGWNNDDTTVTDCYATGSVTGIYAVGGLVGHSRNGTITGSYSTVSVVGGDVVGGLVGWGLGTVTNCHATGSVIGSQTVGGLAGFADNLTDSYATGSVNGNEQVGGLAGQGRTVSNSYATGNVTGNFSVGGLVGWHDYDTVSNCYATGSAAGNNMTGGLVGWNEDNVSNSYSIGSVTGGSDVGGLVGANSGGNVTDSFWDTETSGQNISAGGTSKNTTEMKDHDTFSGAGWSISEVGRAVERDPSFIWNIVNGTTYPFLSWQP